MTADQRLEYRARTTGSVTYGPDLRPTGCLDMRFVRSPTAHARLVGIDTSAAAAAPGVVAVLTAADLALPRHRQLDDLPEAAWPPPLATDRVRYVGERVAVVVAESAARAEDAVELVEVDYDPLDPVVDPRRSLDGPPLHDGLPDNVARQAEIGEPLPDPGPDTVTVRLEHHIPRVAQAPLEGAFVLAHPEGDRLVVHTGSQGPGLLLPELARDLGLPPESIRVVLTEMGGGVRRQDHRRVSRGHRLRGARPTARPGGPLRRAADRQPAHHARPRSATR